MNTRKGAMRRKEAVQSRKYHPDEDAGTMLFYYMVFFTIFVAPYFLLGK